jgi:glycosyltransferase involved in cell wall biosynthesis
MVGDLEIRPEQEQALHVAMIGTRGVPARYSGFETAVEEVGARMVQMGHEVSVYCRAQAGEDGLGTTYLGMRRIVLPAVRTKTMETLSHTAVSTAAIVTRRRPDAVFMFNAANAVLLPAFRARRIPVATHVDGLEWKRAKWEGFGQTYYRRAEELAVRWSDALIADAAGIADYYRTEFDAPTELLSYGAPILRDLGSGRLATMGLRPAGYHLVVARFEPENHVDVIVEGYRRSRARLPLVVVGSAPYSTEYIARVEALASGDDRIRLVGSVWDQDLLNELYGNAATYLHGHSVGGTNPSLLRAMGAGAPVIAYDVVFNREVVGSDAPVFDSAEAVAQRVEWAEDHADLMASLGRAGQERAAGHYRWDDIANGYAELAERLTAGYSIHGPRRSRRA